MKRENFVAGMVTGVFTIAFLFMGVAALMYIYEKVDRPEEADRPEKVGRFVPPASEVDTEDAIIFVDNSGTFKDATEITIQVDAGEAYLLTVEDDSHTVFAIEYEGDTIFYTSKGEEMVRIAPNGYIYVRGERVTRDMTVYKGLKHWLMKMGLIPEPKEEEE